jgi:hypothetical protein
MNTPDPASGSQPVPPASVVDVSTSNRVNLSAATAQVSATGYGSRVTTTFDPSSASAGEAKRRMPASTFLGDIVGSLLGRVSRWLNAGFVERSLILARTTGQYAVLGGGALTLVYAIYGAIKFNSFAFFLTGLGFVAGLAVAQFAATRFLGASTRALASTPSQVSSPAFLECVGLLVLLFAVGTLAGGVITSIQLSSILPMLPAIFTSAALVYFGAVALHPLLVNVEVSVGTAGEEAIGLLSFFVKAGLKLAPLFFALLAVGGTLAIAAGFFEAGQSFASAVGSVLNIAPLPVAIPYGFAGSAVVLFACLIPIGVYALFLLQYLAIDVLQAILSVPAKLEALRR